MRRETAPRSRGFIIAAAVAGGLAVPPSVIGTTAAVALTALLAVVSLLVWRWSGLPSLVRAATPSGIPRIARPLLWFALGLAVGLVTLALMRLVIEPFEPSIGRRIAAAGLLPVWRRLAIIYVAAVLEELIFRVLVMSAVAGVAMRVWRLWPAPPPPRVIWTANVVASLLFGAAHLPSWSGSLGATLALPVVALNLIVSLVLGHVFATRGLAAAVWTHAGGDCAIQLIGPLTA